MSVKVVRFPYGKGYRPFPFPEGRLLGIIEKERRDTLPLEKLLDRALTSAACTTNLRRLKALRNLLIVVPDQTRNAYLRRVIPRVLSRVGRGCRITIAVATGLHEPLGRSELETLLGKSVLKCCHAVTHAQDASSLVVRGRTARGVPIVQNRIVGECDGIVTIGVVEPHLYAGYSGGAKTIAIGLAGEATINATHSPAFLDDPKVRLGAVRGNPFQATLWEAVRALPVTLSVNIVHDPKGDAVGVTAGSLRNAFDRAVTLARSVYEFSVDRTADVVVCGVGYPKDENLYQASRAFNYIINSRSPVLKRGGTLLLVGDLKDGFGRGLGEKRCAAALRTMKSPARHIAMVKRDGCAGGDHRAYMIAKALVHATIIVVSDRAPEVTRGTPLISCRTPQEALALVDKHAGANWKAYAVPHALSTIATVA